MPGQPIPNAPGGPRYVYHEDDQYRARLKKEVRGTWYHVHREIEPRGFARRDDVSGPSPGDLVVTKQEIHRAAGRAFRELNAGTVPQQTEMDALEVVVHEHTHCLVRLMPDGSDHPGDDRIYSHPSEPVPAILHAFGPDCRFGVNAFTGVLRLRPSPRHLRDAMLGRHAVPFAWGKGLAWFASHLEDRPTPYPSL